MASMVNWWKSSTPTQELTGPALRDVIVYLIEYGRVNMPEHAGLRMEERNITGGEILTALRRGVLRTDSCVAGKWRYLARRSDVEVCFTFDIDDDGNLLVLVTVIRRD
ncbi:MAG TPA: DUF4258 domain-containing protein [Kofleriaceae bacterium]|nr:DUF4258 domain-containing protein [Kofleriaceae bacterium]